MENAKLDSQTFIAGGSERGEMSENPGNSNRGDAAAGTDEKEPLYYIYEPPPADVLNVNGNRFSGDFFRFFTPENAGKYFRLERLENGDITIETISGDLVRPT